MKLIRLLNCALEYVTTKNGGTMEYRIEYADGKCYNFAHSRKDLIEWLKILKDETITDIRKIYKNGVSDSVIDIYKKYIVNLKNSMTF